MRGLEAAALAAVAYFALRALRRRLRAPQRTILLQVRAPGRAAPRDDTQRTVVNADAMAWMRAQTGPFPGSVVTGIPDISEVSLAPDEYRAFFLEAVELILRRTPTDGVAVFCQTDCRIMAPPSADCAVHKKCRAQVQREWLDKSHLLQIACSHVPHVNARAGSVCAAGFRWLAARRWKRRRHCSAGARLLVGAHASLCGGDASDVRGSHPEQVSRERGARSRRRGPKRQRERAARGGRRNFELATWVLAPARRAIRGERAEESRRIGEPRCDRSDHISLSISRI